MKRITKKLAAALLIPVFIFITGMTSFADTAKSPVETNQCQTKQEEVKKETQTDKSIIPAKASDSISKTDTIKDSQTDNDAKTQSDKSNSDAQKDKNDTKIQSDKDNSAAKSIDNNTKIQSDKEKVNKSLIDLKPDDIEIQCTPDIYNAEPGDVINYTITITNKSLLTLRDITISDPDKRLVLNKNDKKFYSINIGDISFKNFCNTGSRTIKATYTVPKEMKDGSTIITNLHVKANYWCLGEKNISNTSSPCTVYVSHNLNVEKTVELTKVAGCQGTYDVNLKVTGREHNIKNGCDVVIVIDSSGSMGYGSPSTLEYVKDAVGNFVDEVLKDNKNDDIKDNQIAVLGFADETYNAYGFPYGNGENFSKNKDEIMDAVDYNICPGGETNMEAAFKKASETVNKGRPSAKKVIVFFSDGSPTISDKHKGKNNYPTHSNHYSEDAINAAKKAQKVANVFTIGYFKNLGDDCDINDDCSKDMKTFAANVLQSCAPKGNFFNADKVTDIYKEISSTLNYSAINAVVKDVRDKYNIDNFDIINDPKTNKQFETSSGEATLSKDTIIWNIGTIMPGQTVALKYRIQANSNYKETEPKDIYFYSTNNNYSANISFVSPYNRQEKYNIKSPLITVRPLSISPENQTISTNYLDSVNLGEALGGGQKYKVSGGCYGEYSYKWYKDSINENNKISESDCPVITPETLEKSSSTDTRSSYKYILVVTDKCGEIANATLTIQKASIKINEILEGNDPTRAAEEFEVDVNGQGSESDYINSWNTFMKSGESQSKTFGNIKLGNYKISEPHVPHGYKAVSIIVDYGNKEPIETKPDAAADGISANIDLINNSNVTVTITNQVTDNPWFTGEDIKDNNFDTAKTLPGPSCSADLLDKIIAFDWKEDVNGNDSEKM